MNDKTCHYCARKAIQNVVWLKDKHQRHARIVLPHCGCDLMEALRRFWPCPYQIQLGIDYTIEPLFESSFRVEGDGASVTVFLKRGPEVVIAETDGTVCLRMPKRLARELAKDVEGASHAPETGCDDPDAHWHGHCGCK